MWAVGPLRTGWPGLLSEKLTEWAFDALLPCHRDIAKNIASETTGLFTAECGQSNGSTGGRRLGCMFVRIDGSKTRVRGVACFPISVWF